MNKFAITAALATSLSLSACATNPYGSGGYNNNGQVGRAGTGAVAGAVAGGILGAVVPGVSTTQGAIAGAVLGGVAGLVINNRQYYRATNGYCYYVDSNGQPHYDYNVRC